MKMLILMANTNMSNNTPSNMKWRQDNTKITQQFLDLMAEYKMRKSKLIKYVPTEKELRDAMKFYSFMLGLSEEGDPNAIKLIEILDYISNIPEEQIKFTGFMNEILAKHPTGEVPHELLMDTAEKWDVLEYVIEDIMGVIGIKLKK